MILPRSLALQGLIENIKRPAAIYSRSLPSHPPDLNGTYTYVMQGRENMTLQDTRYVLSNPLEEFCLRVAQHIHRILSGNITRERDAWELTSLVDQIQRFAVTRHRD